MQISIVKIPVFAGLLGVFYMCGGFVLPPEAFDTPIYYKHNPLIPWALVIVCFVYGAVCALWGNKVVGIIHPISFRGAYVVFGALVMALALLFTSCVRYSESHQPNKSTHGISGDTTHLKFGHRRAPLIGGLNGYGH